ncbi:hypothetical protein [Ruegeria meonggei]|uniref:Uncharacterized protein n=1 Tax=Ruegeria meonggei TaxID=1446476 RepID=A0A1X6Y6D1_9RHOB|nr:hypothetical protein [Ruegeria meonggei]SLN12190.1 hypothetical protein RUM8411_00227 [Ruegeria meonggei]
MIVKYLFDDLRSIFAACMAFGATEAIAQSQPSDLILRVRLASASFEALKSETRFSCAHPESPVVVELSVDLTPNSYDSAPFRQTELTPNSVVVRRDGTLENDRPKESWQKTVSTARFTKGFVSRSQQEELTDLTFQGSLFFCDYEGFPTFVGAEYTVSGTIGAFTLLHHQAFATQLSWTVSYRSWKQVSHDGKQIVIPKVRKPSGQKANKVGFLSFELNDVAVPLIPERGDQQLLVNLIVHGEVAVTEERPTP